MKTYCLTLIFVALSLNCFGQDKEAFFNALKNIDNYDVIGFIETFDNKISNEPPLIIPAAGYQYIYPYDLFIKVYDKDKGVEYYTRDLFFVTHIGNRFSVYKEKDTTANIIYLEKEGDDYYFYIARFPDEYLIPHTDNRVGDIINDDEIVVIDKLKLVFFKPIGKIVESINNRYFRFEKVEEMSGDIVFDYINFSNVNILNQIDIVKKYIVNNDLRDLNVEMYCKEYYIDLLNEGYNAVQEYNAVQRSDFSLIVDPLNIKNILRELLIIIE